MRTLLIIAIGVALAPCQGASQMIFQSRAEIGRVEHRVRNAGQVEWSSGTVFGGALGLRIGGRLEVWGEARGGRLAAQSPDGDDREFAEIQLVGARELGPWLTLQGGAGVRSYASGPFRQRWTTLRVGAEARVPLALEGVRGVVRGQWMPVVAVSGLARPNLALGASVGVEWLGSRVSVGALYTLERYDFPGGATTKRLEEISALQVRVTGRFGN